MNSIQTMELSQSPDLDMTKAPEKAARFAMGWRDLLITPLVQLGTFAAAALPTWKISTLASLSFLEIFLVGYAWLVVTTLVLLAFMRTVFPIASGTYTYTRDANILYRFNLYSYLCITNLYFLYTLPLIWQPYRKYFYLCMGAKFGSGLISIGGRIAEPHLVTVEAGAILGEDALILPHATSALPDLTVTLAPIHIGHNSVIGARAILFPGVTVGAHATVAANSVVTANTVIPEGEIWGGIPARRIRAASIE